MAETYEQAEEELEPPVNPYSLLEAVNNSSDTAHMGWLIFIGVMAYLMIAVTGVTHKDLLLQKAVQLPLFQIEIPQVQFFEFAPVLLVLFHMGVVSQLVMLARKVLAFDIAVAKLEATDKRTHPLRLELHNFFFVQGVAGPERSRVMAIFLHGMSWLTLVVLPVLLLLYIQISFLPYHDIRITWSHRIALGVDITMLILIGVFLSEIETSFFRALGRSIRRHPVTTLLTTLLLTWVTVFSFFVATVPGEALDRMMLRVTGLAPPKGAAQQNQFIMGFTLPFLPARQDGTLFGLFHRNLIVTDYDLVVDKDVGVGETSHNLRGRDLRYARLDRTDLHQADLTGANLDGASLVGADLRGLKLQCGDLTELILSDDRKRARCASARDANLSRARLSGATMGGIDLRGAKFEQADLQGAGLSYALLSGANFSSAKLDGADLTGGAQLQGANFLIASLQGTDLTGAALQFADFSSASMQGANLNHAELQSAVLRDADLSGAQMKKARLEGADFTGADVRGADLRESSIWMTTPPDADRSLLADMSGITISPLDKQQAAWIETALRSIESPGLKQLVRESLNPLLEPTASARWEQSSARQRWSALFARSGRNEPDSIVAPTPIPASGTGTALGSAPVIPPRAGSYPRAVSSYLVRMVCRSAWTNGGVATGIAKRGRARDFNGARADLFAGISASGCEGGKSVDPAALQALHLAVEATNAN